MTATAPAGDLRSDPYLPLPFILREGVEIDRTDMSEWQVTVKWSPTFVEKFAFKDLPYRVLELAASQETLATIRETLEREFGELYDLSVIEEEVMTLWGQGILASTNPVIESRRQQPREPEWWRECTWTSCPIPLVPADGPLTSLHSLVAWMLSRGIVTLGIIFILTGAATFLANLKLVAERMPRQQEYFALKSWAMLAVAIIITKSIHELWHGIVAKHFGVPVSRMGIWIRLGMPCLYCEVSQIVSLKNRWQKFYITLAGIYGELLMASMAVFIWLASTPGLVNHLALAIVFACSINTLLFNLNPVMRFDGHYALAYAWGRNELQREASQYIRSDLGTLVFGRAPDRKFDKSRDAAWLAVYGIVSLVYGLFLVSSILRFLYRTAEPYGLGVPIILLGLYTLVFKPLKGLVDFVIPERPKEMKG